MCREATVTWAALFTYFVCTWRIKAVSTRRPSRLCSTLQYVSWERPVLHTKLKMVISKGGYYRVNVDFTAESSFSWKLSAIFVVLCWESNGEFTAQSCILQTRTHGEKQIYQSINQRATHYFIYHVVIYVILCHCRGMHCFIFVLFLYTFFNLICVKWWFALKSLEKKHWIQFPQENCMKYNCSVPYVSQETLYIFKLKEFQQWIVLQKAAQSFFCGVLLLIIHPPVLFHLSGSRLH